jgi:hypothetical protein
MTRSLYIFITLHNEMLLGMIDWHLVASGLSCRAKNQSGCGKTALIDGNDYKRVLNTTEGKKDGE